MITNHENYLRLNLKLRSIAKKLESLDETLTKVDETLTKIDKNTEPTKPQI